MRRSPSPSRNPEGICRLCEKAGPLQKGHFLPAAMYRYLNRGDNRHIIVNKRTYFSTSRHVTAHLLCRDCEQRFSSHGEKWMMENGFRGQDKFKLQAALKATLPLGHTGTGGFFSGTDTPGVDMDQLTYFAASVFWRSSAHRWPDGDSVDLGPLYQEQFRQFLVGAAPFPKNASLVVHISDAEKPMEVAYFPNGGRVSGVAAHHQYRFMLPGILFTLVVGGGIPEKLRLVCAVHSPNRLIFLSSRVQGLVESIAIEMVSEHETVREVLGGPPA